jgi:hypothetical protein
MFGDFAPALVSYTDDALFGDLWPAPPVPGPHEPSIEKNHRKCNKVPVQDFLAGTLLHCVLDLLA